MKAALRIILVSLKRVVRLRYGLCLIFPLITGGLLVEWFWSHCYTIRAQFSTWDFAEQEGSRISLRASRGLLAVSWGGNQELCFWSQKGYEFRTRSGKLLIDPKAVPFDLRFEKGLNTAGWETVVWVMFRKESWRQWYFGYDGTPRRVMYGPPGDRRAKLIPYTEYSVPFWSLTLLSLMPSGWALWSCVGGLRRATRRVQGKCFNCGYDLHSSHGACPECGSPGIGSE